jgi:hypothetical protein
MLFGHSSRTLSQRRGRVRIAVSVCLPESNDELSLGMPIPVNAVAIDSAVHGVEKRQLEVWASRSTKRTMARFYEPDLISSPESPFVRDSSNRLVRRSYWLDMDDRTLVLVMTKGIGANLTNEEKRAHLADLRREHLIDQVCIQEILPPEHE